MLQHLVTLGRAFVTSPRNAVLSQRWLASSSKAASAASGTTGVRPVVVAGPSGSGKSTLIRKLVDEFPAAFGFCVSHTSRAPRPGETDGVAYHFSTLEAMQRMQERGEFIELASYNNNLYGTSLVALKSVLDSGRIPLLDIDMQGILSIKTIMIAQALAKLQPAQPLASLQSAQPPTGPLHGFPDLMPKFILVVPPGVHELESRLTKRGEPAASIERRVAQARNELLVAQWPGLGLFEVTVENTMLSLAYPAFRTHVLEANAHYNYHRSK